MKSVFAVLLPIALFCTSCDEDDCCVFPEETFIEYGTSFGFCVGYCVHSITLTENNIGFTKSAWTDQANNPNVSCNEGFNDWKDLINKIDLDTFMDTEETIGCPDCADGGAEWIAITSEGKTHRVTFEFNNTPTVFEDYIETLRENLERMTNSCQ